jgi:hypothetical protein
MIFFFYSGFIFKENILLLFLKNFIVSHIYREGNNCADSLANLGLGFDGFLWWQDAPNIIRQDLVKNMLGMPNYRFTTF